MEKNPTLIRYIELIICYNLHSVDSGIEKYHIIVLIKYLRTDNNLFKNLIIYIDILMKALLARFSIHNTIVI